jgi:hypothetical protein
MAKYTGRGGIFRVGTTGATPTYTDVAQISSIGSIAITADETEVTTLDNIDGFKEFLQTFKDSGELPITIVWDPSIVSHGPTGEGLWGLFLSGETRPMQIEFPIKPVPYIADFDGFVKSFPTPAMTPADALTADVSIRVSGTVALGPKTVTGTAAGPDGGEDLEEMTPEQRAEADRIWRESQARRQGARTSRPPAAGTRDNPALLTETLDEPSAGMRV